MNKSPEARHGVRRSIITFLNGYGIQQTSGVMRYATQNDDLVLTCRFIPTHSESVSPVPDVIQGLCHFIRQNRHVEFLFRLQGNVQHFKQIIRKIEKGDPLDYTQIQPADAAAIIKQYLRQLSRPLIPKVYHTVFLKANVTEDREIALLAATVLLPASHIQVLKYMMQFFNSVAKYSEVNKMDPTALSVCITPSILPVVDTDKIIDAVNSVKTLIEHCDRIGIIPEKIPLYDEEGRKECCCIVL
ncbi:unnamed protein product [Acanthoscelides obtectus]|uniref:Rho-GAP domain-containing protein n=1 Tax=Acanthoscelides obtectus TaxID=200917 RepID=A0A9P0M8V2_ACAOB|nr:unnamed protein product [Acanthoscelides obtectus]CAK1679553.1 Rho GTPase-activating protein 11A [Acanthoscelides obtectus]